MSWFKRSSTRAAGGSEVGRRGVIAMALTGAVALSGCGFEPIAAAPTAFGEKDVVLSSINVTANNARFRYRVRQELLKSVTIDPAAEQSLNVRSRISTAGLAITQADTITRRNITASTGYTLRTASDRENAPEPVTVSGNTSATTAVNTTSSPFSAEVATEEAVERLALETARRVLIVLRVNRPEV